MDSEELLPSIEETMDMNLIELLHFLRSKNVIEKFFESHRYRILKNCGAYPNIIGIQYMDGINKIWRPKWARETRGRFYDISGPQIVELRSGLSRGIELLTLLHTQNGVSETSDVDNSPCEYLDDVQKMLMAKFSGNNALETWITAKVDGCLIMINIYPSESSQYPIICDTILQYGDDFSKKLYSYCLEKDAPIITISSKGTLLVNAEMQQYFQTALEPLVPCYRDWDASIPIVFDLVTSYLNDLSTALSVDTKFNPLAYSTLVFEAYCKNRRTFAGEERSELAVGYKESGMNLLGMLHGDRYFPHFELPKSVFPQPAAKKVSSTREVFETMAALDDMVCGKITSSEFLSANFPLLFGTDGLHPLTSRLVHPEGFVVLTPLEDGSYDYSKIKTNIYYKCHKLRERNLTFLRSLPPAVREHYPVVRDLAHFYERISPTIAQIISEVSVVLLGELRPDSACYDAVRVTNARKVARFDAFLSTRSEKDKDILCKLILNSEETKIILNEFALTIVKSFFELSDEKKEAFLMFTKMLLMKLSPWKEEDNWRQALQEMVESGSTPMDKLYEIFVK